MAPRGFLDLPPEIRSMIYRAIRLSHEAQHGDDKKISLSTGLYDQCYERLPRTSPLIPLLCTCKTVRDEAQEFAYPGLQFHTHVFTRSTHSLHLYMTSRVYASIKKMKTSFDTVEIHIDGLEHAVPWFNVLMEMLGWCATAQKLIFSWHEFTHCGDRDDGDDDDDDDEEEILTKNVCPNAFLQTAVADD